MQKVRLDLCHVGILRAILAQHQTAKHNEFSLYALLEAKDVGGLKEIAANFHPQTRDALIALPSLYGDAKVLEQARHILPQLPEIHTALDELVRLIALMPNNREVEVTVDLADLRGLH